MIEVAVNGYCLRNPGGATGWAYVFEDQQWRAGGIVRGTTQVGELLAVLMLLKEFPSTDMIIQSNSGYVVGACTAWKRSWQRKNYLKDDGTRRPNSQILIPIHHLLDISRADIQFVKVPDRNVDDRFPLHKQASQFSRRAAMLSKQKGIEVIIGNMDD